MEKLLRVLIIGNKYGIRFRVVNCQIENETNKQIKYHSGLGTRTINKSKLLEVNSKLKNIIAGATATICYHTYCKPSDLVMAKELLKNAWFKKFILLEIGYESLKKIKHQINGDIPVIIEGRKEIL